MRWGAALGVLATTCGAVVAVAPTAAAAPACAPWTVSTVASGLGLLENVTFDDRGTMLLSRTSLTGPGAIAGLTPDGTRSVVVPDVTAPGGLVVRGDTLYFTTGNGFSSGLLDVHDGTVEAVDLDTGARTVVARDVVMPNGLAVLDDGDLLVTRNLGTPSGVTRVDAGDPNSARYVRTDVGSANGLAVDDGTVYVSNTFEPELAITVLDASNLGGDARRIPVDGFGPVTASDDLTVGPDGQIYLAQNLAGRVLRIDPESGASCVIGTGLPATSAVEFGGVGWDPDSLYATSFDGSVRRLAPA
ncbi:SMP-30/gluconolactonase/LRE family protein [Rhodococcus sp. BP-252]|uniref:SMP-30/gluconolactonase/LRE family protein n=1 Tax=unclassified Rhodococcus (in: high G+C Gram-positive bacteria) TaxID=192944 RepID=UPI001431134D|nr:MULTISPECIES: SMP-30/gluconolactonase/LRE family protein [unclassified Rhodococcus (in: high G+C Gram-positive bacteria)]MBY6411147.1 SMP-30/gluconolactonase/LRE family protein [Rhodococcus sp. BP-320]MBY6415806.1 SMP-30/gluconolactonase/LRE family protein [Rhodococcus sp. BP-321]MBY6424373.1 SMP-30/gluconolactonase/LRE family protein [Rhodococcus sp. BP-324]MBY6425867.1 SMP-30/gluconolactonase/LRE family protein [Rhodococcus sp. BP-323]MBY6431012.1 SMP-30/gluconolactonase/LRE family protei